MERLMASYVERGLSGCSILIGGDRGSGKTSLVLKVAERLRSKWFQDEANPAIGGDPGSGKTSLVQKGAEWLRSRWFQDEAKPPTGWNSKKLHEILRFPRPLVVRVHGPKLFDVTSSDHPPSRNAMRLISEALFRALADEIGELFQSRASTPEQQEQAAQFRLDLDNGPSAQKIREMWTLLSKDGSLGSVLATPEDKPPADQALREMLAVSTSIQICREIRQHRSDELKDGGPGEQKASDDGTTVASRPKDKGDNGETTTFWRVFARLMLDGGKLVHPLAGLFVGSLVFMALIRSVENFPVALLAGLLSGFCTTILLNFAAARNSVNAMLPDASLASLDRTIPALLRRVEDAGLFPIIVIDELDKELERGPQERDQLDAEMDRLIRDMKYFVAEQAFVCFLTGRRYYDKVVRESQGQASERKSVDTFFTNRVLVSHTPDRLLQYLQEVLTLENTQSSNDEYARELTFLKHLFLFRAKGHLADLQDVLSRDRQLDETVFLAPGRRLLDISIYADQVFYQLAVHRAIADTNTEDILRTQPDLLEPLNQALYAPARVWEDINADSFVLEEIFSSDLSALQFPVQCLIGFLHRPTTLFPPTNSQGLLGLHCNQLANALSVRISPLVRPDQIRRSGRWFITRHFSLNPNLQAQPTDSPDRIRFRSASERAAAINEVSALQRFVLDLTNRQSDLLAICRIPGLLDFTIPQMGIDKLLYRDISESSQEEYDELAEFYAKLVQTPELRHLLAIFLFSITPVQRSLDLPVFLGDPVVRYFAGYRLDRRMVTTEALRLSRKVVSSPGATQEIRRAIASTEKAETFVEWVRPATFLLRRFRSLQLT
ncbi:MAG: hypothetical protein JNK48_00110 [Bryobacterales bacterium]|nr:hypothetical protein [Bryobacterales bacterium]